MKIKMVVIAGVVFSLFFSLLLFMMVMFVDSKENTSAQSTLGA